MSSTRKPASGLSGLAAVRGASLDGFSAVDMAALVDVFAAEPLITHSQTSFSLTPPRSQRP
jgi:hypothetical protein